MKKHICFVLLFFLIGMRTVHAARGERKALEVNPTYVAFKNEVETLRSFRYALQGARSTASFFLYLQMLGAGPKIIQAIKPMLDAQRAFWQDRENETKAEQAKEEQEKFIELVFSETYPPIVGGAIFGAVRSELYRRYIFSVINHVFTQYTTGYNFRKLPIDEAIMVMAAYKKNAFMMRKLKPFMHHFLEKQGVWEVLAQLYFRKDSWWRPMIADLYFASVTPQEVEKLKAMLE